LLRILKKEGENKNPFGYPKADQNYDGDSPRRRDCPLGDKKNLKRILNNL